MNLAGNILLLYARLKMVSLIVLAFTGSIVHQLFKANFRLRGLETRWSLDEGANFIPSTVYFYPVNTL